MITLYLIKEKEETEKIVGIVCGDNMIIDNSKKEVKLYIKDNLTAIIDFYRIEQTSKSFYNIFI